MLIYVLLDEYPTISRLFGKEIKYQRLLNELKKYTLESVETPYQKDLLKSLNLSRDNLMEMMNDLYFEFMSCLGQEHEYMIKKTKIWLLIDTRSNGSFAISLNGLDHIPQIGETIFVPFIRGEGTIGYFNVTEIEHEYSSEIHSINIFVNDNDDLN